jgi:hypothetical protein
MVKVKNDKCRTIITKNVSGCARFLKSTEISFESKLAEISEHRGIDESCSRVLWVNIGKAWPRMLVTDLLMSIKKSELFHWSPPHPGSQIRSSIRWCNKSLPHSASHSFGIRRCTWLGKGWELALGPSFGDDLAGSLDCTDEPGDAE